MESGRGITYARLEHGGLQWPCPTEDHPGTTILHSESFAGSDRAPRSSASSTDRRGEVTPAAFPFLLITGRSLYQFNAGTMTMRTPNAELRPNDTLDIAPADAPASLGTVSGCASAAVTAKPRPDQNQCGV